MNLRSTFLSSLLCLACGCTGEPSGEPGGDGGSGTAGGGSSSAGGNGSSTAGGNAGTSPGGGNAGSGGSGGSSSGGSGSGGGASGSGGNGPGATGGSGGGSSSGPCGGLGLEEDVRVASADTDRVTWYDANCRPRSAAMVRVGGGYVRQFTYDVDGAPRVCTGTGANGHPGWGYSVNHFGNTASLGNDRPGSFGPVFVGDHHALYRYQYSQPIAGEDVDITLEWFFATGRSHPVLAITYHLDETQPGSLVADSRTPYGDLAWDGDENANSTVVSGVGWGDRYHFVTTREPLTMDSTWDYSEPNLVPYVMAWTSASDAEMGAVQTQTYLQHDAGGYWYYVNWGQTSATLTSDGSQVGRMPATWNWTYQINQYELCIEDPSCLDGTTGSHRLAWGTNYGAIGGDSADGTYPAYGDDRRVVGYPYQSYSVFMVLGKHSDAPVRTLVEDLETVQEVSLTASVGVVPSSGPGGVGRSDSVALEPPGYDARYSVWRVQADGSAAALEWTVGSGALHHPVLVVDGYSAASPPAVSVGGERLTADTDYAASTNPDDGTLWITFLRSFSGSTSVEITPGE